MNTHSRGEMSRRIHQTNLGCLKRERIGILIVVRGESSIHELMFMLAVVVADWWDYR